MSTPYTRVGVIVRREGPEQLKDVVLTISSVDYDDQGDPYAVTRIYRYDLVGPIEQFITDLQSNGQIVHGGQIIDRK